MLAIDSVHLRGRVHRLAGLSLILTARGDVDRGTNIAGQMLDHAAGMESGRIRDRIGTVITALRPHVGDEAVADVLHRAGYEGWM